MTTSDIAATFTRAAEDWLCDGYSLDVRYLASALDSRIWSASMHLNPLPPPRNDLNFHISGSLFQVGQIQQASQRKSALLSKIESAIAGELEVRDQRLILTKDQAHDFFSEMAFRDRWFSELHVQVLGNRLPIPSSLELARADNELRIATPPFDGVSDVCAWLGLAVPGSTANANSINVRIGPPVDLIFDECRLVADQLTLTIHAHPKFDVGRVRLAIRAAPGSGLQGRNQIAKEISWGRVKDGRRPGVAKIKMHGADSALAMLMIENSTVRRQWFVDPAKARNNRFLAVQNFDKDLRMVRQAVLESTDSEKFEQGVAALLFLLGFTPSIQVEKDAPDLVVTTPGGKIAVVECTTRTSDFATKVGKLVDRRGSLSKYLAESDHPAEVTAVLVCRLPRDRLPAQANEVHQNNVILVTCEDLSAAFDRVRTPEDPDKVLSRAISHLTSSSIQKNG